MLEWNKEMKFWKHIFVFLTIKLFSIFLNLTKIKFWSIHLLSIRTHLHSLGIKMKLIEYFNIGFHLLGVISWKNLIFINYTWASQLLIHTYWSTHLFIYLSISLYIYPSILYLPVYLSIYPYICRSIYLSIYLSIYPCSKAAWISQGQATPLPRQSAHTAPLSIYLSINLSIHQHKNISK